MCVCVCVCVSLPNLLILSNNTNIKKNMSMECIMCHLNGKLPSPASTSDFRMSFPANAKKKWQLYLVLRMRQINIEQRVEY
jgi:hypothetical protein